MVSCREFKLLLTNFLPGIKRESQSSSNWITSDGQTSSFKLWNWGEPNNSGNNEGCAEVNMASITGRYLNDIACDGVRPFSCFKILAIGEEYIDGTNTCTCTSSGVECAPSFTCTDNGNTVNPAQVVVIDDQTCVCTENGFECQDLTECPEFIRMDEKKTYAEAKATCAEMGGFVSFFKDESEYEKYISEDNRNEWLGKYPEI